MVRKGPFTIDRADVMFVAGQFHALTGQVRLV